MGGKSDQKGPHQAVRRTRRDETKRNTRLAGLRLSAAGLAGSAAHTVSLVPENNAGASAPSISIALHRDPIIREAAGQKRHPCTARRRAVVCARVRAPAPTGQGERQECQRVRTKSRTLKERSGKECVLQKIPLIIQTLPIVTDRPRLQAWFAQRIERAAVRQRPLSA